MKAVIIGCGLISASHANAITNLPDLQLVAASDANKNSADKIAEQFGCTPYYDSEKMLDETKPDIAVICIPTFLHEKYVEICAKRNVHILCEKPLERSTQACKRLLHQVRKAGIIFMTAQVVRFWPGYVEIKKMFDDDEIGEVYMMQLRRLSSRAGAYSEWLFNPDLGGGAMHDMLVHDVDFLRYIGGPFAYCYANAAKGATGCYNNIVANIVHKNGWHAVAEASFTMQAGYPFSFSASIIGSHATVEYSYAAGATIADRSGSKTEMKVWREKSGMEKIDVRQYDAYQRQMEYFVQCVSKNMQPEIITPEESFEVIAMIDAIHSSADANTVVHLKHFNKYRDNLF